MDEKIKKYLFDIYESINNIDAYVGSPKLFNSYETNPMLQDAVERNLEIIGEAMNNILKIDPEISITNARRMVDARNKISHGYDEIDAAQIWNIIINHLPILKTETDQLLNA